jgi:hypothetical protein
MGKKWLIEEIEEEKGGGCGKALMWGFLIVVLLAWCGSLK